MDFIQFEIHFKMTEEAEANEGKGIKTQKDTNTVRKKKDKVTV